MSTPTIDDVLAVVRKDLDPVTRTIVEEMIYNGHRLAIIRDAFLEGKDALAVKMIRDLDPLRRLELLPLSKDLRGVDGVGLAPGRAFNIIVRPQRYSFAPRYLVLAQATADAVDISDIRIGNRSQYSQAGEVPGEMFAVDMPEATLTMLDMAAAAVDDAAALDPIYTLHVNSRGVARLPLPIDFEPVQTAMDLVVTCTNISGRPLERFRGAFLGAIGDR